MLRWSMAHRAVVVLASLVVIVSVVPLFMAIGKDFVPEDDRSELQVSVRLPEGSGLAATLSVVERIASDLRQYPEVADTLSTIGGGTGNNNPVGLSRPGGRDAGAALVQTGGKGTRPAPPQG